MKYRFLTYQEFDLLKDDFYNYLYDFGFNDFEWKLFSDYAPTEAINLIEDYSDDIFDRLIKDVKYLEYRSDKELQVIECKEEKMVTIGLNVPLNSKVNLTDLESIKSLEVSDCEGYKCFKEIKEYSENRDQTVFRLIEKGYQVVNNKLFEHLNFLRLSFQN